MTLQEEWEEIERFSKPKPKPTKIMQRIIDKKNKEKAKAMSEKQIQDFIQLLKGETK